MKFEGGVRERGVYVRVKGGREGTVEVWGKENETGECEALREDTGMRIEWAGSHVDQSQPIRDINSSAIFFTQFS